MGQLWQTLQSRMYSILFNPTISRHIGFTFDWFKDLKILEIHLEILRLGKAELL